jgi:hypothetical protein
MSKKLKKISNYDRLMALSTFQQFRAGLNRLLKPDSFDFEELQNFKASWKCPAQLALYAGLIKEVWGMDDLEGRKLLQRKINEMGLFHFENSPVRVIPHAPTAVEWQKSPTRDDQGELVDRELIAARDCSPHLRGGRYLSIEIDLAAPITTIFTALKKAVAFYTSNPIADVRNGKTTSKKARQGICRTYTPCATSERQKLKPFEVDPWLAYEKVEYLRKSIPELAKEFASTYNWPGDGEDPGQAAEQRVRRAYIHAKDIRNQVADELNLAIS